MGHKENGKDVHEQDKKETLEFERIQAELEDYGEIMQSCIEEAERTLQIWRGTPSRNPGDTAIYLAMMPAISVALFEKVTKSAELRDTVERIKGTPSCSTSTGQYKVIEGKDILAWFRETIDGKGEGAKA